MPVRHNAALQVIIFKRKGRLESKKVAIESKKLYHNIRVFSEKEVCKSLFVAGFGSLIHDFVQCRLKEIRW